MFQKFNQFLSLLKYCLGTAQIVWRRLRRRYVRLHSETSKKGGNEMTNLGLEWLKHKEAIRSNMAKEANTRYQVDTQKTTADLDRTSRENVSAYDRASRERVASLDRSSREQIASDDRRSRENIATADRISRETIADLTRDLEREITKINIASKEAIATLDRESREDLAEKQRELDEYLNMLRSLNDGIAASYSLNELGLNDPENVGGAAAFGNVMIDTIESLLNAIGKVVGGKFSIN